MMLIFISSMDQNVKWKIAIAVQSSDALIVALPYVRSIYWSVFAFINKMMKTMKGWRLRQKRRLDLLRTISTSNVKSRRREHAEQLTNHHNETNA